MKLEEEKKVVAKKLMGEKWIDETLATLDENNIKGIAWSLWNPQSERKWWDEIWEKMDEKFKESYINNLLVIIIIENPKPKLHGWQIQYWLNIAKPEICWKALIKTLTE